MIRKDFVLVFRIVLYVLYGKLNVRPNAYEYNAQFEILN